MVLMVWTGFPVTLVRMVSPVFRESLVTREFLDQQDEKGRLGPKENLAVTELRGSKDLLVWMAAPADQACRALPEQEDLVEMRVDQDQLGIGEREETQVQKA